MNRIALLSMDNNGGLNKTQLDILNKENFLDFKNNDLRDFNILNETEPGVLQLEYDIRQNTSNTETLVRIRQIEEGKRILSEMVFKALDKKLSNPEKYGDPLDFARETTGQDKQPDIDKPPMEVYDKMFEQFDMKGPEELPGIELEAPLKELSESVTPEKAEYTFSKTKGFEVSTKGNELGKQFSALNAKLKDGRTIELAYMQAKGYKTVKEGKGKEAIDPNFDYYGEYKKLWKQWAKENPNKIKELKDYLDENNITTLRDRFATTENRQDKVLAEILNERAAKEDPLAAIKEKVENFEKDIDRSNDPFDIIEKNIEKGKELKKDKKAPLRELENHFWNMIRIESDVRKRLESEEVVVEKPPISKTEGIKVMRGSKFGNPFVVPSEWIKRPKYYEEQGFVRANSIEEAIESYDSWVRGTAHKDFLQDRRARIIEALESGELVGKTLKYFKPEATDSHAVRLSNLVSEMATKGLDKKADIKANVELAEPIKVEDIKDKELRKDFEEHQKKIEKHVEEIDKEISDRIIDEPIVQEKEEPAKRGKTVVPGWEDIEVYQPPKEEVVKPKKEKEKELEAEKDSPEIEISDVKQAIEKLKGVDSHQIGKVLTEIFTKMKEDQNSGKWNPEGEEVNELIEFFNQANDKEIAEGHSLMILDGSPETLERYVGIMKEKGAEAGIKEYMVELSSNTDLLSSLGASVKADVLKSINPTQEILTLDIVKEELAKHGVDIKTPDYLTPAMKDDLDRLVDILTQNPGIIPHFQHELTGVSAELGTTGKEIVGRAFKDMSAADIKY